jgi:hypothetical protein
MSFQTIDPIRCPECRIEIKPQMNVANGAELAIALMTHWSKKHNDKVLLTFIECAEEVDRQIKQQMGVQ